MTARAYLCRKVACLALMALLPLCGVRAQAPMTPMYPPGAMMPGMPMPPGAVMPGMQMPPGAMAPMPPGMMSPFASRPGHPAAMNPLAALQLTKEQGEKMAEIARETFVGVMSKMAEVRPEAGKLQELYAAEVLDPEAIGAVYGKLFDAQRELIVSNVTALKRQLDVLTPEQKELLQKMRKAMTPRTGQKAPSATQ